MTQQSGKNNRYKIVSRLCSGGMADIFLGIRLDQRFLERFVAIKKVHTINKGDKKKDEQILKFKSMFADEARIISTLSHPHIVQILDFTEKGDNFHIVMEYIDGENLGYILNVLRRRDERVPMDIGIRLMIQALEALQYIHSATSLTGEPLNIVHRDLDPRNLMIDSNGYLKIIDFGVAKTMVQTELTAPDMFKGKLSHVAPEVFTQTDIDLRADIYSLGLVLFEIATGERPYRLNKSAALADTIQRIINEPLPRPSEINPDISDVLEQIIVKACNKDREKRYQSADELHVALTEYANTGKHSCGIATNAKIKEWFSEQFQERLIRRRNFESNALQKARQSLEKNRAGQSASAMTPVPGKEEGEGESLAPEMGNAGCQVTGIESIAGVSFATGVMEKTPSVSSVSPFVGASRGTPDFHSAPGQRHSAPPSSVGSFMATTPPLALDNHTGDDGPDTFSGSYRRNAVKIALATGSVAIAVAIIFIFVVRDKNNSSQSSTHSEQQNAVGKMITVTEPILSESSQKDAKITAASRDTQGGGNQESGVDSVGNEYASNGNEADDEKRIYAVNRNWKRHRTGRRSESSLVPSGKQDAISYTSKDNENEDESASQDRDEPMAASANAGAIEIDAAFANSSKEPEAPKTSEQRELPKTVKVNVPPPATGMEPAPAPQKDNRTTPTKYISGSGDWSGAKVAKSGCGSCHSVSATSKTTSQWEYFFSHNRHRRHGNLKASFSKTELRRVESYLKSIVEKSKTNNSGIAGIR